MTENETILYRITAALAAVEDVDPTELEYNLASYVDPETLVQMTSMEEGSWEFTFNVPRHEVTITQDESVFVDGMEYDPTRQQSLDAGDPTGSHSGEQQRYREAPVSNVPSMIYRRRNQRGWPMDFVSGACRDVTGYDPNAFIVGGVSYGNDVIYQDDRMNVWNSIQESLQDGDQFTLSYRIRTAEGEVKRVWERGDGIFDENKATSIVGHVSENSSPEMIGDSVAGVTRMW